MPAVVDHATATKLTSKMCYIYIIILDPNDDNHAYVCNITPWLTTPFQLISGFFHVNQGVLCLLSKLPPAVCWGGGGGGGATGLLNEGGGSSRLVE